MIVAIHAGDSGTPAPVPAGRVRRIPPSAGAVLNQPEGSMSASSSHAGPPPSTPTAARDCRAGAAGHLRRWRLSAPAGGKRAEHGH